MPEELNDETASEKKQAGKRINVSSNTKTRRLARDYLAAVDKVFNAIERAKKLRTALRRAAARHKDNCHATRR